MTQAEKLITWWEPAFGSEESEAVMEVVRSGYVNEGDKTRAFTDAVAAYTGAEYVEATCSGTVALFLALKACGVGEGDEVIVPDLTFIATASAVVMAGARPRLVDIRLKDLNMDPEEVEKAVNPRTKAILPVHVNGRPADMVALRAIAQRHNLALIEDAAEALGSRTGGKALGTLGDAGCISLAPTKIITSAQGGLVLTNRKDIRDQLIRLKDHGRLSRSWNYHPEVGFNFKYNDILAALALVQFGRMQTRVDLLKSQYTRYRQALSGIAQLSFVETDLEGGTVPLWVDVLLGEGVDSGAFINAMKQKNIVCRPFWPALHLQEPYRAGAGFSRAEYAARQGCWLPSGQGKSEADIDRVAEAVRGYFRS